MGLIKDVFYLLGGIVGILGWALYSQDQSGQAMPINGLLGIVCWMVAGGLVLLGWLL